MISLDSRRWDDLLSDPSGLWYSSDEIWPWIEELFVNPPSEMTEDQRSMKSEMLAYFATRLQKKMVTLGNRPEFFNDDDRWTHNEGWKLPIDTVVIHHTATKPRLKYTQLNALSLLRLYCPLYMNSPAFLKEGNRQPVSSGHFYMGEQTFVGYTWVVYNVGGLVGWSVQVLDNRYTGFHAGNYAINCRSIGIAIVGDLSDQIPQRDTIIAINKIIASYPDVKTIMGHKDVPRKDGKITACPGSRWVEWKDQLVVPI